MYYSKNARLLLLIGLLVFAVAPQCLLALTRPPNYMPHYVKVYASAKAWSSTWDAIPDSSLTYQSDWTTAISGSTEGAGVAASSLTAGSSAWAAVSMGSARGVATASANFNSTKAPFARGTANAWLYWGDTLTVTSSTLPNGTPVTLLFTMRFDATTYTNAGSWYYGRNDAEAFSTFWIGGDVNTSQYMTITYRDFQPPSHTATMNVFTSVGSQIWIHGETYFDAMAAGSSTQKDVFSQSNVADTASFYVDPLTAGASYTTDSGIGYATPVPEPSALMTLGLGLSGLASIAIRRRSA